MYFIYSFDGKAELFLFFDKKKVQITAFKQCNETLLSFCSIYCIIAE